jgi:hypothetical protein
MKPQAQRAYEAYCTSMGRVDPQWECLTDNQKEAWRAAVVAAIDSPPTEETITDKQVRLLEETQTAKIAKMVKEALPPDRAFILFTTQYGPKGNLAYAATMTRDDAVRVLREWLKRMGAL